MNKRAQELLKEMEGLKEYLKHNQLDLYKPYQKQKEFHFAKERERMFMAGNQLGKTLGAGNEVAMHVTGRYPKWWEGKKLAKPNKWWVAGVSGEGTRDNPQKILLGEPGNFGTGTIPKSCIKEIRMSRGVPDSVDTVLIKHVSGGDSRIQFKSYEKGREKWQGVTLDGGIWFDEEPPADVYTEGLTRTNVKKGMIMITFTPLLGMSDVVMRFLQPQPDDPPRHVTNMTIWDVVKEPNSHYSKEEAEVIINSYPPHERKARSEGEPMMGSGKIYPIDEELLREEQVVVPDHWPRLIGLDIGYSDPTAAVWGAWDKEHDVVHIYDCYKQAEQTPIIHAAALRARESWIPVAWPHDALFADKGSGEKIAKLYRDQGLNMLPEHARYTDTRKNGVEDGLWDILQRMQTGRLKVAEHLNDWFNEFRMYHRKDGKVVKRNDHLMDATRYLIMMLRFGKPKEYVQPKRDRYSMKIRYGKGSWMAN